MKATPESILKRFVESSIDSLNICTVAKVVNVDDLEDGFITVQPLINNIGKDFSSVEMPVISYVPVIMPSTKHCGMVFPIEKDDTVLLVFGQHSFEQFKLGASETHDPQDMRRNDLSDAVAYVGFLPTQESVWSPKNNKNEKPKDSVKVFNNLGETNENFIMLNKDGTIDLKSNKEVNVDAPRINAKDVVIEGVGSVRNFMLTHLHPYTDDGNPMQTGQPIITGT